MCFRIVFYALLLLLCHSCRNENKLFESLPSSTTNIKFTNKLAEHKLFNILYYLYYYNGGGVATGDINNDGLPDIYFTANNKGGNKLYLNKGDFQFEDITDKAGVAGTADWCTGVTMADVNGDGFLDIYVGAISGKYDLKGHNQLFINNGNGTFKEQAQAYGLDFAGLTTQAAFFDYDHDGDLDCYILNQSSRPHANVVDTSNRRKFDPISGDRLYRNDVSTTGKFTDVSAQAGIFQSNLGYGLGLAVADLNNDGWEDIYVGNDFHENDYYYVNNKNGTFSEEGAKHFRHYSRFSMGNDIADYNNDGQLDVVTVDMLPQDEKILKTYGSDENPDIYKVKLDLNGYQKQYSRNALQRNNGNGTSFSDIGLLSGISATDWSWSPLFVDFDNDGNKDLFISSGIVKRPVDLDYIRFISDLDMKKGRQMTDAFDDEAIKSMPDGSSHPYFYKGDGKSVFTDVSEEWGTKNMKGYFTGAAYADLNNDGRVDIIINNIDAPATILKNNTPQKLSIDISFNGNNSNTFGIGAKAWLFTQGKVQYQQLMPTRGFQSASEPKLHFGLDSLKYIDSILIVWPDQKYQVLKNTPALPKIIAKQSQAGGVFDYNTFFPPAKQLLENVSGQLISNWKHVENDFVDYNVQYLIPHGESDRGPKLAVADVNGDGLDDLYACGAIGQPGTLLIQQSSGKFVAADTAVFNADALCEDVDAVFFDANGDKKPDLYVVSGGNQYADASPYLADRLYINDGKGHFTKSQTLPSVLKNKSCISTADIDNDGDEDIFVGVLADASAYGIPQTSVLLINDGKANFSVAGQDAIPLSNIGMVTSSAFSDINGDGWKDLIVAGEWMPINIFINEKGKFKKTILPHSSGLWQTVFMDDINKDGRMDILAGNWGHNTKLWAGKNGPCKLYVKDFDKNGSVEQVMAYTIDGQQYPFLAKDELERRLPVLKKAYLNYSDVAGKTVQYMLYDLFEGNTELTAEELGSCYFLNDGKGGFTKSVLPADLQLAPIFSFVPINKNASGNTYVIGGNFFNVIPYEGRYDAQALSVFSYQNNAFTTYLQPDLLSITGQVRDIKSIRTNKFGEVLVVAKNNEPLLFFKPNN